MKTPLLFVSRLSFCQKLLMRRNFSSWLRNVEEAKTSVPAEILFTNPQVQGLLYKLTGVSFEKVFEPKPQETPENPFYRLMTSEELEKIRNEAEATASTRLQMPPLVEPVPEEGVVLSNDDEIAGFDTSRYIFTDITYGISDKDRTCAVREPGGILRTANCQEKERMIRLYFPKEHREYEVPGVFIEPHLENALHMHRHLHILDWACVQFEPYDPEFVRVSKAVFEHANMHDLFHLFWSTRHCGNLIFYLVVNKEVDNYLVYLAKEKRIEDMRDVVRLYNLCHEDSHCASMISEDDSDWKTIQTFVQFDAKHKGALELILQSLEQEFGDENKRTAIN